jgi:hypothetical protein
MMHPTRARRGLYFALVTSLLIFSRPAAHADELDWVQLSIEEGVELYGVNERVEGQLPFRAITEIDEPYQKIVMALVDYQKKPLWAPKLKTTRIHHQPGENHFVYSEYYSTPWPFYDREFLLDGKIEYRENGVFFKARNFTQKALADNDHVLVDVAVLIVQITPVSPEKSRIIFTFSGNMGGWIPDFVKTIITRKWPVRFLQALENYLESEEIRATEIYRNLRKKELLATTRKDQ